jgi:hypothetical protein
MTDTVDGIHRLIEMLEARFGKLWATMLLVLVVLAVASWALHTIVSELIVPSINLCVFLLKKTSGKVIYLPSNINQILSFFAGFISVVAATLAGRLVWYDRQVGKAAEIIQANTDKVRAAMDDYRASRSISQKKIDELTRSIEELERQKDALLLEKYKESG